MTTPIRRVAVLGSGTMGHGIAQALAQARVHVRMRDVESRLLSRAMERISANLDKAIAKGKLVASEKPLVLSRIEPTLDLANACKEADLVIEAAPESLDLKRSIFQEADRVAPEDAILATNTSSLSVTEIASAVRDPARFVGMHFFNPPYVLKLVEIVRGARTSDATVATASAFARSIGKTPIVVRDSPGFASSRLGVVLGLEAMRMLEQGVANAADIDSAMELGYGHPMGPLKTSDLVGLDVRLAIAEHLYRELKDETYRPPEILRRFVREGKLGKKTGEGFYRWDNGRPVGTKRMDA